jgi:hypothetical protein
MMKEKKAVMKDFYDVEWEGLIRRRGEEEKGKREQGQRLEDGRRNKRRNKQGKYSIVDIPIHYV